MIILGIGSANERRRYRVTSSLIGWAYPRDDARNSPHNTEAGWSVQHGLSSKACHSSALVGHSPFSAQRSSWFAQSACLRRVPGTWIGTAALKATQSGWKWTKRCLRWRNDLETLSVELAVGTGGSPYTVGCQQKRPVIQVVLMQLAW